MPKLDQCDAYNDAHDCGLPADHAGDHECAGCHDVWNRGPWDDDADEWRWQRPDDRCIDAAGAQELVLDLPWSPRPFTGVRPEDLGL